jgi:hypothetical protein
MTAAWDAQQAAGACPVLGAGNAPTTARVKIKMRELTATEVQSVDGGIIPAIAAGFMAYNYIVATYSATQIAFAAGAAIGGAAVVAAAAD